ncbi:MAG: hypothetical protein EXR58_00250 [Chloroflexi bacterium]|nr:hypothetical protein [Chloroflexota bacterium]
MSLKSTQIYLTEAEHAAVQGEAGRSGLSMTAVIRGLVEQHLMADKVAPTDLTDLIGVVSTLNPTDVGARKDAMLYEALIGDIRGHERPLRVAEPE